MARPSKFTPETTKRLTDAIRMGATYDLAAKFAGISYSTFQNWMNGEGGIPKKDYLPFLEAIEKAEGDAAVGWLTKIEKAANDGAWQAAAWKLERRYASDYGRTVHQHEGTLNVRVMAEQIAAELGIDPGDLIAEAERISSGVN
jgi:hypothetical protein